MGPFLSDEWVHSINAALALGRVSVGDDVSVRGAGGTFCVVQRTATEGGAVITALRVVDGQATFALVDAIPDDVTVTVLIDEADARGLNDGSLTVASALGTGRIKVRGDLSVLVGAQTILRDAMTAISSTS